MGGKWPRRTAGLYFAALSLHPRLRLMAVSEATEAVKRHAGRTMRRRSGIYGKFNDAVYRRRTRLDQNDPRRDGEARARARRGRVAAATLRGGNIKASAGFETPARLGCALN